jgi:hypothetical protein
MECLRILESLAIIAASGAAICGVSSWRREIKGRRKYELAEEVLSLFYEARDRISAIRSPFGYVEEGETRKKKSNETPDEEKALNNAYVVFERYQKNQETFNRLHALRYRFMAIFGQDKIKPFYDLNKVVIEIFTAARMLSKLWHMRNQTYLPRTEESYNKILEDTDKYEAIFWEGWHDPDPITPKVEGIISEIDKICEPILREKPSWLSKIFMKKKPKASGRQRA